MLSKFLLFVSQAELVSSVKINENILKMSHSRRIKQKCGITLIGKESWGISLTVKHCIGYETQMIWSVVMTLKSWRSWSSARKGWGPFDLVRMEVLVQGWKSLRSSGTRSWGLKECVAMKRFQIPGPGYDTPNKDLFLLLLLQSESHKMKVCPFAKNLFSANAASMPPFYFP